MTTPFYTDHPDRLVALRVEAARWMGTPFRSRSGACGPKGGVDCVRLAAAIEIGAGAIPAVEFPRYQIDAGSHLVDSPLLNFLRGTAPEPDSQIVAAYLQELPIDTAVRAGDVLALKDGRTPYHLAIATTDEGDFVHVRIRGVVQFSSLRDSTYADALQAIFRPVVPAQEGAI